MTAKWQFDNWQHNGASMWTQWQRIIKNNDNDISEEYLTKCTKMTTSEITCTLIYKPRLVLTFGAKLNATTTCRVSNCGTPTKHLPSDQSLSKCLVHTWYTSRPEQSCGGSTATAFVHWSPTNDTDEWFTMTMKALTTDTEKWTLVAACLQTWKHWHRTLENEHWHCSQKLTKWQCHHWSPLTLINDNEHWH